jgi:hypothetical protein
MLTVAFFGDDYAGKTDKFMPMILLAEAEEFRVPTTEPAVRPEIPQCHRLAVP